MTTKKKVSTAGSKGNLTAPAQSVGGSDTPPPNTGRTFWDLVYFLISDWKRLPQLLLSLVIVGGFLLGVWALGLYVARSNRVEVVQTDEGGIIYRVGKEETLSFLLAASSPWAAPAAPDKFKVEKGEMLHIRASGRVNLAVHHLVDAANKDDLPRHFWVGPEGMNEENFKRLKRQDRWRKQFLLVDKQPYGALIAGISSNDQPPSKDSI